MNKVSDPHDDLSVLRHSVAHLLAHAVVELFPGTKLTIGPATPDGFFYDFLPPQNFKEEDLPLIEARMRILAKKNLPITHEEISKEDARKLYKDNPFKLELIDGIEGDTVGISIQGDFKDLCRGGHVASTGKLNHFKLHGISGSYWRGDKNNPALQRISGAAFHTKKELDEYEHRREEAAKYDHRKVGKQLDYFSFSEAGPGFPFFHPKGQQVLNILKDYMRSIHKTHNFQEVSTPTMLSADLWHQSGHDQYYKDDMYFSTVSDNTYALKPMNCPGAFLIYNTRPRSYRELPLKLAEFGHVHRHELSGVLHGLMRVRAFTIDDTHIFCTLEQLQEEIEGLLTLISTVFEKCDFTNVKFALATKPDKAMGSDAIWKQATDALETALKRKKIPYTIKPKEGAFYGPKIEVDVTDSLGRIWTCGTVQVDFLQPENFDLSYIAPSGKKERPVVIHTATYGSLERFFAVLLEHFKGLLPFWLAPVQARILTITERNKPYAQEVYERLKTHGFRVEIDSTGDPLSGQIKRAQEDKVPVMFIIGDKEMANKTVTIRHHNGKQEFGIPYDSLIEKCSTLD